MAERPKMATAINSLANYSAAIPSGPSDPDSKAPEKANLGTLMGVYLPCIQNIFGVILFIRMTWIVGTAGAVQGFFVVFLACCVVSPVCLDAPIFSQWISVTVLCVSLSPPKLLEQSKNVTVRIFHIRPEDEHGHICLAKSCHLVVFLTFSRV